MKLRTDAAIKTDSLAIVKFAGLMGQNFISISFGSPGAPLAVEGTVIGSEEQPDLSAIMAKLDKAASGIEKFGNSFSGDKIDKHPRPAHGFLQAEQQPHRLGGDEY